MGPTDSKRSVQTTHVPAHGSTLSGPAHPTVHASDSEPGPASVGHGDRRERHLARWDSAWIDLGGEG